MCSLASITLSLKMRQGPVQDQVQKISIQKVDGRFADYFQPTAHTPKCCPSNSHCSSAKPAKGSILLDSGR